MLVTGMQGAGLVNHQKGAVAARALFLDRGLHNKQVRSVFKSPLLMGATNQY